MKKLKQITNPQSQFKDEQCKIFENGRRFPVQPFKDLTNAQTFKRLNQNIQSIDDESVCYDKTIKKNNQMNKERNQSMENFKTQNNLQSINKFNEKVGPKEKKQQQQVIIDCQHFNKAVNISLQEEKEIAKSEELFLKENQNILYQITSYAPEIFKYNRKQETKVAINNLQTINAYHNDLNEDMRMILVNWLTNLHMFLKLQQRTLFLSIKLIDIYLVRCQKHTIRKEDFQKLGITAFFIAFKFEDMKRLNFSAEFLSNVTNKYVKQSEILDMEGQLLSVLNFDLAFPVIYDFLEKFHLQLKFDPTLYFLASYIIELSNYSFELNQYPPSLITAASIYLSCNITGEKSIYEEIIKISGQGREKIKNCVKVLLELWVKASSKEYFSKVYEKYSKDKYKNVSTIKNKINN